MRLRRGEAHKKVEALNFCFSAEVGRKSFTV
jgi:hypothetical protein